MSPLFDFMNDIDDTAMDPPMTSLPPRKLPLHTKPSVFSRLKESLMDLIFEEVEERPIGMSGFSRAKLLRLANATASELPQSAVTSPGTVFFKHLPTFQDYHFLT